MGTSRATDGSITTDETPSDGKLEQPKPAQTPVDPRRTGEEVNAVAAYPAPVRGQLGHRGKGAGPRAKRRSHISTPEQLERHPRGRLASVRSPSRCCEICNLCVDAPDSVLVVSIDEDDAPSRTNPRPAASGLSRRARRLPHPPDPANLGPDGRPCDRTTSGYPAAATRAPRPKPRPVRSAPNASAMRAAGSQGCGPRACDT